MTSFGPATCPSCGETDVIFVGRWRMVCRDCDGDGLPGKSDLAPSGSDAHPHHKFREEVGVESVQGRVRATPTPLGGVA